MLSCDLLSRSLLGGMKVVSVFSAALQTLPLAASNRRHVSGRSRSSNKKFGLERIVLRYRSLSSYLVLDQCSTAFQKPGKTIQSIVTPSLGLG